MKNRCVLDICSRAPCEMMLRAHRQDEVTGFRASDYHSRCCAEPLYEARIRMAPPQDCGNQVP